MTINIAKGTTDPRVELCYQSLNKFKHKSWSNFIFRISTKHSLQNHNQTSASRLNLKFKILTKASFRIFRQDFEAGVWLSFCCWYFEEVMKLNLGRNTYARFLVNILNFKFSLDADVWLRFWSWFLVEIMKIKFDQDLCKNLWYDLKKLLC